MSAAPRRRSVHVHGLHHGDQPFPVASVVDRLVQSCAIHAMDPAHGTFAPTGEEQIARVFDNARLIMAAAGGSLDDVVAVEVLLRDDSLRDVVNTHWVAAFPDPDSRPVRHTTVLALREPLLVQLKLTAYLAEDDA